MPISREEYEEGRTDISIPILQYLNVRRDEAFTVDEIQSALTNVYERRTTIAEVVGILRTLVRAGRVETKEVSGAQMYTIMVDSY